MTFRLAVDHESVLVAAVRVAAVAQRLDGAPAGRALGVVAAAVPGGRLAEAAQTEAAEWGQELSGLADAFNRYATALEAAVRDYAAQDELAARTLAELDR